MSDNIVFYGSGVNPARPGRLAQRNWCPPVSPKPVSPNPNSPV